MMHQGILSKYLNDARPVDLKSKVYLQLLMKGNQIVSIFQYFLECTELLFLSRNRLTIILWNINKSQ